MKTCVLAIFLFSMAYAQQEAAPEFEVVSIKPAPPPTGNGIRVTMRGGPGSDDPGRLDWNNVSLQNMVIYAFNIKDYQLQGPDWMSSQRFDLVAKIPAGSTREQTRLMMQKLLVDRCKMSFHHESKEHGVFALIVAKGGSKLKPSDPNDTSGFGPIDGRGGRGQGQLGGGRGGMMMSRLGHLDAKRMGMDGLANFLSNVAGKPVIDQTELKGTYDFSLDYAPDSVEGGRGPVAVRLPGGGEPAAAEAPAPDIYAALQQQLGLRMEPKKLPLDNIVIDHIEKVPAEN